MAKSAAYGRNGFDALGSRSDAVVSRHRSHSRSGPSTAIVVEQRPLIRELLSRSLKQRAGFEVFAIASIDEYLESGEGNDISLVLVSIAGNSNSEETRRSLCLSRRRIAAWKLLRPDGRHDRVSARHR